MSLPKPHSWVHPITLAYVPGRVTPPLEEVVEALLSWFRSKGCTIESQPTNGCELLLTTARFGEPVSREEALFFNAKRLYRLSRRPTIMTVLDIREAEYQQWRNHFSELLANPNGAGHTYPGLGPQAVEVLLDQARRGGPDVALERFIQSQVKSYRVLAVRSDADDRPQCAMLYDLAGAYPTIPMQTPELFVEEAGWRILTAACAHEVDNHVYLADELPAGIWAELEAPDAMVRVGERFTPYGFFSSPVHIEKLLGYRGFGDAISAQYSEGCYAVFEPDIPGLVTTATGSSRLVDKRSISRDDQAVLVGVKPEGDGAVVRPVEGIKAVPSVEAVEMMSICAAIPGHERRNSRGKVVQVPNLRALLHGHAGVEHYNPDRVERVMLDLPFYTYLVSCGTGALAQATAAAFARSEALRDLKDPRRLVFLEQPGHGVVVIEKWAENAAPFDLIYDCLQTGDLKITHDVPQGMVEWEPQTLADGRRVMRKK